MITIPDDGGGEDRTPAFGSNIVRACVCLPEVRKVGPWLATVTRQTVNYIRHEGRQFTSPGPFTARDTQVW